MREQLDPARSEDSAETVAAGPQPGVPSDEGEPLAQSHVTV
jgi:hypothetical protein